MKRTWAEVDFDKLAHNYHALRGLAPAGTKYLGLVKADAYGHGAVPVAKKLEELGADYLGVACLDEAIEVREAGVKTPILILGCTSSIYAAELVKYNITQACYDLEYAKELSAGAQKAGGTITVHIQCDTGMTRLGFMCHEDTMEKSASEIIEAVKLPGLKAEGIFTHFSDSDGSEEYTMLQFGRFQDIIQRVRDLGYEFEIRHCANSAATLLYPATYLDMIRPGIVQFGHFPDAKMDHALCDLVPVLELKSRVATVRDVPANTPVSYGRTNTLTRPSRLAVIPVGYGDGFCRGFSNKLTVLINGKKLPIVGRICMDMCMVDVTDAPDVKEGDVAILYGSDGTNDQPVEAGAEIMNTISYELLCVLTKRIPRIYLNK
ncbi:alanine racemase [Evtepia sp.]|uniref:alanine racemase n=1 Tax=Evtepia sp. TaxID=2773933 RepID=UPI002E770BD2|nr:alanine racemase [Evtepia sp.]MDD7085618.1 alanine racemase [Clostridiales bacterium]MEE0257948.1 alanine racemase [Evtepia sp.]